MSSSDSGDFESRTARTSLLLDRLLAIVEELEALHPGRRFPLDGHLVGSLGEGAAEAMFTIQLVPASTPGHDAITADGRHVEIKATYGDSGVGIRPTSHDQAQALIVLRLSRHSGQAHEVVYNGPVSLVRSAAGPVQSNGQSRLGLGRLRQLDTEVPDSSRVPWRTVE